MWMALTFPTSHFERFADDVIVHCRSEAEARTVLEAIRGRLAECGLELHSTKTKIVYCKDDDRPGKHDQIKFDFLGYRVLHRHAKRRRAEDHMSVLPSPNPIASHPLLENTSEMRIECT